MIRLLHGCLLGSFVAVGTSASAATFVIDDFITVQCVEVTAAGASSAGSSVNTTSAIGIERDLFVEKTAGTDGERARVRINPNSEDLLRMTIDEANARVTVTWDGADNLPGRNDVDYDGLGGIDLSAFDTLNLSLTFSDIGR